MSAAHTITVPTSAICRFETPETRITPSQIKKKIAADPKSGCKKMRRVGRPAYNPDTKMWRVCRISTCRREKYFASISTNTSFIGSAGSREKIPRLNQLCAPRTASEKTKRAASTPSPARYRATSVQPFRKNLQSTVLAKKNNAKPAATQIAWRLKK